MSQRQKKHHQELLCPLFDERLNQLVLLKKPDKEVCCVDCHFSDETWSLCFPLLVNRIKQLVGFIGVQVFQDLILI